MSILGNLLWFVLGGFLTGMIYIIIGIVSCVTIIGIPFGFQLIKIGFYAFMPFGKSTNFGAGEPGCFGVIFNILWVVTGWWEIALLHLIIGGLLCITIIGIPFGYQHFKIAKLSLLPFGQSIN